MLDNLRHDTRRLSAVKSKPFPWYVLESLLFENGYQAVVLYRLAHWFRSHRVPLLGPLIARLSLWLTGVDISPAARIGPGLMISHGTGIVIGGSVRIGAGATMLHQVTLGGPTVSRPDAMPVVGDNVFIGAGAMLIGDITIGDDAIIGAGVLVTENVPAGSRVTRAQPPAVSARRRRGGEPAEAAAEGDRERAAARSAPLSSTPPAPRRPR